MKYRRRTIQPLIDWPDDELWAYLRKRQLPLPSYYAQGFRRIGCIACPMTSPDQRERELALAPNYRDAFILAAQRRLDAVPAEHTLHRHFQTGADYFRWWMSGLPFPNPDQAQLTF
jgi:phosphoadenosine phosphosulfate reductase